MHLIQEQYRTADGWNIVFGTAASTIKSGFAAYIKFIEKKNGVNSTGGRIKRNDEENIIIKALVSQIEELFPGHMRSEKLENREKRIDLLLENKNDLSAIKIVVGKADDKVVGSLLNYMGEDIFNEKTITGIIIADSIDDSLRRATKRDERIELLTYEMNLLALKGEVSRKRCIIYEVRSVRKLFNCGVYYHFLFALPILTALKGGVLDPTANKNNIK